MCGLDVERVKSMPVPSVVSHALGSAAHLARPVLALIRITVDQITPRMSQSQLLKLLPLPLQRPPLGNQSLIHSTDVARQSWMLVNIAALPALIMAIASKFYHSSDQSTQCVFFS